MTRRELLELLTACPALVGAASLASGADDRRGRMGVCVHSCGIHQAAGRANNPRAAFKDAPGFLDYCH